VNKGGTALKTPFEKLSEGVFLFDFFTLTKFLDFDFRKE
jgi:hypothetical protein